MKVSELKQIIREVIEESGPARRNRRKTGSHLQDTGRDPLKVPLKYRQLARQNDSYADDYEKSILHHKTHSNTKAWDRNAGEFRKGSGIKSRSNVGKPGYKAIDDKAKKLGESEFGVKDSNGKNPKKMKLPPHLKGEFGVKNSNGKKTTYDVPTQHQRNVAKKTLKMNDTFANIMGGPNKAEAKKILGKTKKIKEEKKYNATPPLKGFNRTEPMAYKKNSLSGKIAGLNRKLSGKKVSNETK